MGGLDGFFAEVAQVLTVLGLDVDAALVGGLFWLVVAVLTVYVGYKVTRASITAGIGIGRFTKDQIERRFWQDPGKLRFVIGLVLLTVAYAFYGGDQPRPLAEALLDIGRGQILGVMPLAILTQWTLLMAFWIAFGLLMGVPLAKLGKPLADIAIGMTVLAAELVLFALVIMSVVEAEFAAAVAWFLVFAAANLPLAFTARAAFRKRGLRERPVLVLWLVYTGTLTLLLGFIAVCATVVFAAAELGPPTQGGVVKVVLIVVLVIALIMCFRFRSDVLAEVDAPESLLFFIDFSLALATGVVAVIGVQQAPVTLGPVPSWLVAVGPPLIVAAMILLVHLRRLRESTPRWTACLVTGVLAAFLVLPATAGLALVLGPVLPQVDLPFL
ncbi:hypothetical protein AB0B28_00240 [Glycomyces sp. NPDC046736]|uniref:hypothetical protein n=1 Tax=Glycomyces sp. NPDC046736 TaxID=3155615 RepID=UPI00340DF605